MTGAILACLIVLPSWGGEPAYSDLGYASSGPLVIVNPYVGRVNGIDYTRCVAPTGSLPLRIRNPFVPTTIGTEEPESTQCGPFAGHVWGRFTAVRVYPSKKE